MPDFTASYSAHHKGYEPGPPETITLTADSLEAAQAAAEQRFASVVRGGSVAVTPIATAVVQDAPAVRDDSPPSLSSPQHESLSAAATEPSTEPATPGVGG